MINKTKQNNNTAGRDCLLRSSSSTESSSLPSVTRRMMRSSSRISDPLLDISLELYELLLLDQDGTANTEQVRGNDIVVGNQDIQTASEVGGTPRTTRSTLNMVDNEEEVMENILRRSKAVEHFLSFPISIDSLARCLEMNQENILYEGDEDGDGTKSVDSDNSIDSLVCHHSRLRIRDVGQNKQHRVTP